VEVVGTPRQNPVTHRHFDVTAALKSFPTFRYTPVETSLAEMIAEASRSGMGGT
jgi:hypothetical protein